MSSNLKKTGQPRKACPPPAETSDNETAQNEGVARRKSTRLSSKPLLIESKKTSTPMSTKRIPVARRVFRKEVGSCSDDDDDSMPPPKTTSSEKKKKLLMSPRTTTLTNEVESLSISNTRTLRSITVIGKRTPTATNLKSKLTQSQQRTPEKKPRDLSPETSKTEKKAKFTKKTDQKVESSNSSDSSDSEPEPQSSTASGALKGRVVEFDSLKSWILESKVKKTSLSIYISGQPGTGKTATTLRVLKDLGSSVRSCMINCASTNTKTALFKTIFEALDLDGKANVEKFEEHVKSFKVPLVLVLDEIDLLATRKNAALYAAFQWPDTLSHKIIILGIANSIDLTERLLPKLMLAKTPKRLVFEPYTKDDIVEILNEKMKTEEAVIDAKAIELTARKVAAMSGDLRTALHIFKQQKSRLASSEEGAAPPATPGNGCREVLGIINSVYSSPLARARLPLQPRILLAVSLALSSNKKSHFDRNSLLRAYYKACEAIRVPALDDDDLHSAFQTLESQSFVRQLNGGKLVLQVDAPTAKSAISDNSMLDQIGLLQL
ncbi:unnamed protein product [Caenorhabditis sp. 36 PRJEB53466]|nr:unnamed protein product [Caenorhabditis sp. 36 PRJEB53466]